MAVESNIENSKYNLEDLPKENLQLLLDTVEGINQTIEFKTVLAESMEAIRLVMKSEASTLMLIDKESGELYLSMPTGPAKQDVVGKSIPKNKGIAGWVAENRRPYLTNDAEKSEYFYGELTEGFKTKSIICVPLINRKNEVIGVMQALNRRSNGGFNPHDIPVFQALASHVTIAIERTRQIDLLHDRLKHKDTMIVEIHHRIKNNLQTIMAMIDDEMPDVVDEHAKNILQVMTLRIHSMSQLHDLLSEKNLSNTIELSFYLEQLSEKIEETMRSLLYDINIHLNCEKVEIKQERALLCGLILNELLVNIYKHAFRDDEENGRIEIHLIRHGDEIELKVSDNGVGLPEDFKLSKKHSIGMWIVNELLKKLEGRLDVSSDDGTRFSVKFPAS
ncbi:MAG: GAF domain-containing protein [Balneolaceae bacterium]